jgi:isoquinoline 1-oxidoreductase beta subunit
MSLRKIARRTFLLGSAAVAGGVAFGVYLARRALPNPLLDDLGEGEAALTPYVKIDPAGVTLICPRADIGQGIESMQAYLIAEELDVDPMKVAKIPGPPDPAYYNGHVTRESAPFPGYESGWLAETARDVMEVPAKLVGLQITGGSISTPDAYVKLRAAGATARETLKKAASLRAGAPVDELRTEDGAVVLPDGRRIPYPELAAEAAKIDPITDVPLRPPKAWRYLGKAFPRTDVVAKSTGTLTYGIDVRMDGMLHATVKTNPGLGGALERMDDAAAREMRGVQAIVPVKGGFGVIADNTWRAFRAADAVKVEWAAPPYPPSSAEMWEALSDAHTEDRLDSRLRDDGDVEAALAGAEVLEAEYRTPYLAHAPLEPPNAVVKAEHDRLDIWTGTQIPLFLRDLAAAEAGLAPEQVHVHVLPSGGSFGRRLECTYALQAVEVALAKKGTPIKMTWSREEDMGHGYPRPMHLARCRGAVKDGRVHTYDLASISQSMTASWFGRVWQAPPGPDVFLVAGAWDQPFAIPNYRVSGYRAPEMVPCSSWRAPGANSNGFFHDGFLDELIHAAGADPLEERIRLCMHEPSKRVLEAVGEMAGWRGPKVGEDRYRGVAFVYSHGVPTAEIVEVRTTDAGLRIEAVWAAAEVGKVLDPLNFEAQMTGGIVFGLGHAMNCKLTFANHAAEQSNFHAYQGMRLHQTPKITVRGLENDDEVRGIGEPTVPPAAPALGNAIFAATGQRIRELPFDGAVRFA